MGWRIRGVRGATTVAENSVAAVEEAVLELMAALEASNQIDPKDIASATFSVTPDIDAIFPAKVARSRPHWEHVPLLDVQHMHVEGDLPHCIRVILHINTPLEQEAIQHVYLNGAKHLRPDLKQVEF